MIGKWLRVVSWGFLLSSFLAVVSVHTVQGQMRQDEVYPTPDVEATLEPRMIPYTPTPEFRSNVRDLRADLSPAERITEDGCCPYPQWSSDSEWILYVDSVGNEGPGLYGVPAAGGRPTLLTSRVGSFSQDLSLVAYPEAGLVYIERWASGDRWLVPTQGREVYLSQGNNWIAWEFGSTSIQNQDLKQRAIWVARINGDDARELVTVHGGRFLGWIDQGAALLVSGRFSPLSPAGIWRIDRESGAGTLLFETDGPRDVLISHDAKWIALTVAFQTESTKNGIWVMRTDGSSLTRLPIYGSYRWRSEGELLVIPYDFDTSGVYLWQVSIEDYQIWELTNPAEVDLPITNNDWQVSPDGEKIVFNSYEDRNLWVMTLPKPPR